MANGESNRIESRMANTNMYRKCDRSIVRSFDRPRSLSRANARSKAFRCEGDDRRRATRRRSTSRPWHRTRDRGLGHRHRGLRHLSTRTMGGVTRDRVSTWCSTETWRVEVLEYENGSIYGGSVAGERGSDESLRTTDAGRDGAARVGITSTRRASDGGGVNKHLVERVLQLLRARVSSWCARDFEVARRPRRRSRRWS